MSTKRLYFLEKTVHLIIITSRIETTYFLIKYLKTCKEMIKECHLYISKVVFENFMKTIGSNKTNIAN